MYIHTTIDDTLINQATRLTGLKDSQLLLEYALRRLIQQSTQQDQYQPAPENNIFWAQLQQYRASVDLTQWIDIDNIFLQVRDTSMGRDVNL